MSTFDTIVVGGGSAGCLIAARLVAEGGERVLLLEAGGPYRNPLLRIAAGYMKFLASDRYLAMIRTEPEPALDGRAPIVPQARILGGGSSVNAMVYMRGQPADYDAWAEATGADWGWEAMLRHFVRLEDNDRLGPPAHGRGGPLRVSDSPYVHPMSRDFVAACAALGVPVTEDFNGGRQTGVGLMQVTARHGWRCSAADAFLRPLRSDARLTVRLRSPAERVLFEGDRAVGVVVRGEAVRARRVVLTAGAFETPKLLMLSGIGPSEELARHGIALVAGSEGVGANLQDHLEAPVVFRARGRDGYFGEDRGWRMLRNGLRFLLGGGGPAATIGVEACAFWPEAGGDAALQIYCVPTIYLDRDVTGVPPAPGLTLNACLLRPRSRGRVGLRSARAADPPLVETGYLRDPRDLAEIERGLAWCRAIAATAPLAARLEGEICPGAEVTGGEALHAHVRRTVKTNYHPCGTVRMGRADDPLAPLGPDGAVKGVRGLWVADASAMPTIPSGNTNAPTMALADRLADGLLGRGP
ncbi:GMC family oxidoreductase N-terminal domain-containing protein [Rubellimicrobium sp. CFH 75288]|uniref:GMC family oxidoreductase n=1 Tax=Rubellimicrobium sp. CFH 75288 TaxID=2697034 RepID=UPI001412AC27|nr:FAD-binding protein [Rubellimicrobium sp. CFH 75288]